MIDTKFQHLQPKYMTKEHIHTDRAFWQDLYQTERAMMQAQKVKNGALSYAASLQY